jgi:hypothetical protein
VLGLQPGVPDRSAELAAGFASLFDVELLGLFLDDLGLLAAMPAARAISAHGAGWKELEPALNLLDRAARRAERRFAAASRGLQRRGSRSSEGAPRTPWQPSRAPRTSS